MITNCDLSAGASDSQKHHSHHTSADPTLGSLDDATGAYLRNFEEGMRLYRTRDFAAASGLFGQCTLQRAGDPLARIYNERCAAFQSHPPSADWKGVSMMTDK